MTSKNNILPVYGLEKFRKTASKSHLFQVEVFDANRHFEVSYPHRHDFYEVLLLTHGNGHHVIDDNNYKIEPPCVFFMSPGQAHKIEFSQDIMGYIFLFTSEFYLVNQKNQNRLLELPFFFSTEKINPPLLLQNKKDQMFLESLFERGCTEINKGEHLSEDIVRGILDLLLLHCEQLYPPELKTIQKGRGQILVKNLLQLIEENYQQNLRINDYAEMLAVTPNHLTQMVKQITGKTSTTLLQEKIIVETKRFLLHTNMTVTQISDAFNFPDQSYFTKYFKKAVGTTPQGFRKESIKNT